MWNFILKSLFLLMLPISVWALDSVAAVDRALVQLIEDGSALQQSVSKKLQGDIEAADLNMLAREIQAYERKVEWLAHNVQLGVDDVHKAEYGKLLDDSVRLSQVTVGFAEGVLRLAENLEADSAGQYQNTFETMTRAMLRLSDDIGVMADRILFTEEQIGIMADRIGEMADRILETQRIQNENIARVQDTTNRVIDKLDLEQSYTGDRESLQAIQQSREAMMEQREVQQQMQEMKAQQQETQEQLQQLRGF